MMDEIRREPADDAPPFLGTWPRVYVAVVVYLAVLIVLIYVFTIVFS
jgi:hypothetical protein